MRPSDFTIWLPPKLAAYYLPLVLKMVAGQRVPLLVVHEYRDTMMAKKLRASSQPERLIRIRSADIRRRSWTEVEKSAMARIARRQAAGDDSGIDYNDIPRLTEAQPARMVRLREVKRKVAVSVRLDP